jgi:predicted DNA binding CopG/RHH family protein
MPKTDIELTEILQVRVSYAALTAIKKAAQAQQMSVAAYVRQVVYRNVGMIR